MTVNQKDRKPLLKQTEVKTPLKSTESVATNKDEKYLKTIRRLSVWVLIISGASFVCGIVNSCLAYYTVKQDIWCPPAPFVAGVLGMLLKSNSKSKIFNGAFVSFSVVGAIMSFTLIILESQFTGMAYVRDPSHGLGIFISICASAMFILLFALSVFGFKRCEFFGENENAKKIVIVQSGNVQQGNSYIQPNKQIVVQPNFGNQPVTIQIFPNGNVIVPNSNVDSFYEQDKISDDPPQYRNIVTE